MEHPTPSPPSSRPSLGYRSPVSPLTFLTPPVSPEAVTCSPLAPAQDARHRAGSSCFRFPRVLRPNLSRRGGWISSVRRFAFAFVLFFPLLPSFPRAQITFSLRQRRGLCLAAACPGSGGRVTNEALSPAQLQLVNPLSHAAQDVYRVKTLTAGQTLRNITLGSDGARDAKRITKSK